MNSRIIRALVEKDFKLYFRNRLFGVVAVVALVAYIGIYFAMPGTVDETLDVAIYGAGAEELLGQVQPEGLDVTALESEDDVKQAVLDGQVLAGIVLPETSEDAQARLYFSSEVMPELRQAVEQLVLELAYIQAGQPLNVEISTEVLGPTLEGELTPPRDSMRSLFAVFLLMVETLGLAALISEEVERKTVQAVLVTPTSVAGFFTGKAIVGVTLAFAQAGLYLAVVGGMSHQPALIVLALLLGSLLVTGVAFLIAALSRSIMSVMAWGVVILVALAIPAFGVMFPGMVSGWVQAIPSYYLADTIQSVSILGAGWGDVWTNLLVLIGFTAVLVPAGIWALSRRFA